MTSPSYSPSNCCSCRRFANSLRKNRNPIDWRSGRGRIGRSLLRQANRRSRSKSSLWRRAPAVRMMSLRRLGQLRRHTTPCRSRRNMMPKASHRSKRHPLRHLRPWRIHPSIRYWRKIQAGRRGRPRCCPSSGPRGSHHPHRTRQAKARWDHKLCRRSRHRWALGIAPRDICHRPFAHLR